MWLGYTIAPKGHILKVWYPSQILKFWCSSGSMLEYN